MRSDFEGKLKNLKSELTKMKTAKNEHQQLLRAKVCSCFTQYSALYVVQNPASPSLLSYCAAVPQRREAEAASDGPTGDEESSGKRMCCGCPTV